MQQKLYREELLQIFPQKLRQRIEESVTFKNLTEIRLRADLPVLIETTQENYFLKKEEAAEKRRAIAKEEDNWILSPEQLKLIFEKISQYSVFAYTEEIGEGFNAFVNGIRIERAKEQLKYSNKQLKDRYINSFEWLDDFIGEQGTFSKIIKEFEDGNKK